MTGEHKLVLASASPRRLDILRSIGIEPIVRPANIDESPLPGESPADYVRRLAREKASSTYGDAEEWVLAADTTVAVGRDMLGKPGSLEDCIAMLSRLSGTSHTVLTGIALRRNGAVTDAVSRTAVTMRTIDTEEIQHYWQSGEPRDKAGGYAIQGRGAIFVSDIRGSYSGVVGLPVFETMALLDGRELLSAESGATG